MAILSHPAHCTGSYTFLKIYILPFLLIYVVFSALLSRWNNIHIHHLGHMNVRLLYDNLVAESEILNKFANNTAPIPNLETHGYYVLSS